MKPNKPSTVLTQRIKLSLREIGVALALTLAAALFVFAATTGGNKGNTGSPVAQADRVPNDR